MQELLRRCTDLVTLASVPFRSKSATLASWLLTASLSVTEPVSAQRVAGVLEGHHTWSGEILVAEDTLVPSHSSLTILPGTRVVFSPAQSTKTDPAFWNPGTELAVAGRLQVAGTPESPVVLEGAAPWGGIVAAPGADVFLRHARIRGADEGLLCTDASCRLHAVQIERGEYGLVLGPGARVAAEGVHLLDCRVGVYDARGNPSPSSGIRVDGATDASRLVLVPAPRQAEAVRPSVAQESRVEYIGDYTVVSDETWRGEVLIAGRVTVVPGAVLTVAPGTRVGFRKIDTNGDDLGEGELLVLGGIRSRGAAGAPVVFESAEHKPAPGDWDKVSLIASEDPDNSFRYTIFRHGVQSLHAHFSAFHAGSCYFEENLRALQFQESQEARIEDCVFVRNKQALRFRDSRVWAARNRILENLYGVHAFRCDVTFTGNTLEANSLGGFLAKESRVTFSENRLDANRDGARMKDPDSRAEIRRNRFSRSAEDALSLSRVEGFVEENLFDEAGLDLVSLEDSKVVFRGNLFAVSGRHALHLKGSTDVDAKANFWGDADVSARIYDQEDDPSLGSALWLPPLKLHPTLDLPTRTW